MPDGTVCLEPGSKLTRDGRLIGYVLRKDGRNIVREPIDVPADTVLDPESTDNQAATLYATIHAYSAFPGFDALVREGYTFNQLLPGTCGQFRVKNNQLLVVSGQRRPDEAFYFDLELFDRSCVAYFNAPMSVRGFAHSRDQFCTDGEGMPLMMHCLTMTAAANTAGPFLIAACGYNKTPLHKFGEPLKFTREPGREPIAPAPYIALVDTENHQLHIVPFSLSKSAIGGSHRVAPITILIVDGTLQYIVSPVPEQQTDVNTGEFNSELRAIVARAVHNFDGDFRRLSAGSAGSAGQSRGCAAPGCTSDRTTSATSATSAISAISLCSRCMATGYCSRECQRKDWKRHKPTCTAPTCTAPTCTAPTAATVEEPEDAEAHALRTAMERTVATVIVQNGLSADSLGCTHWSTDDRTGLYTYCEWGHTLTVSVPLEVPAMVKESKVYPPIICGEARGQPPSLLACTESPSPITPETWVAHIKRGPSIVAVTPDGHGVQESDTHAALLRLNGIMLVVTDLQEPSVAQIQDLSVPATKLMGARSVVLVIGRDGRYYFHSGATGLWPGLFARGVVVAVGDEVRFSLERVAGLSGLSGLIYAVPQDDRGVAFRGAVVQPEAIVDAVRAVQTTEQLAATIHDLEEYSVFAQLAVVLNPTEMRDTKDALIGMCIAYLNSETARIGSRRSALARALLSEPEAPEPDAPWRPDKRIAELNAQIAELKHEMRKARKAVQAITDKILAACSTRTASSATSAGKNIQSLARAAEVKDRVAKAAKMTAEEYGELLSEVEFYAIAELHPSVLPLLRAAGSGAGDGEMDAQLVALSESAPARLGDRMVQLDGSTVSAIVDAANTTRHLLNTTDPTALTFAMESRRGPQSYLPLPVTPNAIAWRGGYADWMILKNEAEDTIRIKLRSMLSGIRELSIPVASPRLTVAIMAMLLSLMQSLCARMVSSDSADDSMQQMLRGLMYMLLRVSSSGTAPAMYVFQLTQPRSELKTPRTLGEWHVYAGVLEVLYRMVVPADARAEVRSAACKLLAGALRRGYVDPITNPMRDCVKAEAADAQVAAFARRDVESQWLYACMLVLRLCETCETCETHPEADKADKADEFFFELDAISDPARRASIAGHLLTEFKELKLRPGSRMQYTRALERVAAGETLESGSVSVTALRAVSAAYFCSRSGVFADAKRRVRDAAHAVEKHCAHDGCPRRPTCNVRHQPAPLYCSTHTTEGMVGIATNGCAHAECVRRTDPAPTSGPNGLSGLYGRNGLYGLYCATHKDAMDPRITGALAALDARKVDVARFLRVAPETVVISNIEPFAECVPELMRGDCELTRRGPWLGRPTRGYESPSVPDCAEWRAILRRAGVSVQPANGAGGATGLGGASGASGATRSDPVVSALRDVDALVGFGAITVKARLPSAPIERMFNVLGLDADDARAVLRLNLRGWQDVNAADQSAIAYLVGRAR
jgi:hypothetical protein